MKPARVAPASAAASRIASISWSLRPGIIGAVITPTGTPASASALIASSRRCGAEARGSMSRASSLSSVVTDRNTSARLRLAMSARMSMSRVTRWFLVTMPTGLLKSRQHLQDRARDLELALDRLVGIGVGAHRHHVGPVLGRGELGGQQLGRLRLEQDPGLEIEAGRQAEIGVGRPREAIDAAVLAAAIGIDRAVERHVGRGVAREDGARGVARQRRAQRRQLVLDVPAVGRADLLLVVVAARRVRQRAAAVVLGSGSRRRDRGSPASSWSATMRTKGTSQATAPSGRKP